MTIRFPEDGEAKSLLLPHAKGQSIALAEQEIRRRVTYKVATSLPPSSKLKGGRFAHSTTMQDEDLTITSPAMGEGRPAYHKARAATACVLAQVNFLRLPINP
jgi:hypothetical protein